nr:hypothetical protein [Burkholderia gladioli]
MLVEARRAFAAMDREAMQLPASRHHRRIGREIRASIGKVAVVPGLQEFLPDFGVSLRLGRRLPAQAQAAQRNAHAERKVQCVLHSSCFRFGIDGLILAARCCAGMIRT